MMIVNSDARAFGMQCAGDCCAQPFCTAGDQNHFVAQRSVAHNVTMFHATHNLPPLTADEQVHSDRLCALIRAEIVQSRNWITFDRFMELALYAPGLGYYSAGAHKLGAGGDFTTA